MDIPCWILSVQKEFGTGIGGQAKEMPLLAPPDPFQGRHLMSKFLAEAV